MKLFVCVLISLFSVNLFAEINCPQIEKDNKSRVESLDPLLNSIYENVKNLEHDVDLQNFACAKLSTSNVIKAIDEYMETTKILSYELTLSCSDFVSVRSLIDGFRDRLPTTRASIVEIQEKAELASQRLDPAGLETCSR